MTKNAITLMALILAGCVVLIVYTNAPQMPFYEDVPTGPNSRQEPRSKADQVLAIRNYIRQNITELSPVTASMGGTFMVTEVAVNGDTGTVKYEDGHNAYIADFAFSSEATGDFIITKFTVRR